MIKLPKTIRPYLVIGLILSTVFCLYSIWYKYTHWGFVFSTNPKTNVWVIEEHVHFMPTQNSVKVSLAIPSLDDSFKTMNTDIIAPNYSIQQNGDRIELTSDIITLQKPQDIYYRVTIYDKKESLKSSEKLTNVHTDNFVWDDNQKILASEIINAAQDLAGDDVQKIITLLNQTPPDRSVLSFLPEKKTPRQMAQIIRKLLTLKNIPSRLVWGIELSENKKSFDADIMVEAFINNKWTIYNIVTGQTGMPENFVAFQHGGISLVDIEGGKDSVTKYSVVKSVANSFDMASYRAQTHNKKTFDFSMYALPLSQQNTLKWLSIFPLAILIVVILRNMIGIKTMGTFTPMLISMSLIQTGLWSGLISFIAIILCGLVLRTLLSKLNLLLVPRISAVVIFVILLIQISAVIGYRFDFKIASAALFFPIIITAWIIERASIIWEEEGLKNATKEVISSTLVAVLLYFIISSPTIRHIMYVFNEINLVILFLVMLLGTYTGYRVMELVRFAPMVKGKQDEI